MNSEETQQHCWPFLKKKISVINKNLGYSILVHAENGKHNINGWGQSIDMPATKSGQKKRFEG